MSHNPDGHLKLHPGYSRCMAKPRRLPWILVLITLGVTACIVIRALTRYLGLVAFRPSNKATKEKKNNVLILAHGRSGSSFLGQIFNSHPEVFYIYEPLIAFQLTTMWDSKLYQQSTMRLLQDIFNCRFKQQTEFLSFMSHMPLNRFSSHALTTPYCKNITNARDNRTFVHCKDLDPLITSLSCTLHKYIVVKVLTHRILPFLKVDQLTSLFNSRNIKIIHLMRDPRAVIASMDRVGWTLNKSMTNTARTNFPLFITLAQKFCSDMVQSLSFALSAEAKFPDRYKLLRYEDLVRAPLSVSQELFDFVRIPISVHVKEYLINSTSSDDHRNVNGYSTFRNNVSALINSWRRQFSLENVRAIESHCWPVLDILQYTPVFSQTLLNT